MANEDFINNLAYDIKNMHRDRARWRSDIVSTCRKENKERSEEVVELFAGFKEERE